MEADNGGEERVSFRVGGLESRGPGRLVGVARHTEGCQDGIKRSGIDVA